MWQTGQEELEVTLCIWGAAVTLNASWSSLLLPSAVPFPGSRVREEGSVSPYGWGSLSSPLLFQTSHGLTGLPDDLVGAATRLDLLFKKGNLPRRSSSSGQREGKCLSSPHHFVFWKMSKYYQSHDHTF